VSNDAPLIIYGEQRTCIVCVAHTLDDCYRIWTIQSYDDFSDNDYADQSEMVISNPKQMIFFFMLEWEKCERRPNAKISDESQSPMTLIISL